MGLTVAALLGTVPALNIAVDPLGYVRAAGWRPSSPSDAEMALASSGAWPVAHGTREAKVLNVRYYEPESVYFGSSTVWSYVDTGYAPLRTTDGRRAFNFGLAGVTMRELLAVFEHVVALKPPARVVIGLEFYMFSADKPTAPGFDDLPLAHRPTYRQDLWWFVGQRLLSSESTYKSVDILSRTVLDRLRFWTSTPVEAAANHQAAAPLSRERFAQLMIDSDKVILTALYPDTGRPFRMSDDAGWSSLDAVRRIVALARAHQIDLTMYISPSHARSFEAIRLLGLWPRFEEWQRGLASVLADDASAYPDRAPVLLWDFCCYNAVTTDPVVAPPGEDAGFRYYADSVHFKTVVGYMVMDRIFATEASRVLPPDFGVLLTEDSVEAHLSEIRRGQREYAASHPEDVEAVAAALESLGRIRPGAR